MKHILSSLTLSALTLVSFIPLKGIYQITHFFIYSIGWKALGYRKSIIIQNLSRSFPDANYKEIERISNQYFIFLSRIVAEWIKSLSIDKESILSFLEINNINMINRQEKSDVFLTLGHLGNWELLNMLPLVCHKKVYAIYKKQSSFLADSFCHKMRCKWGLQLIEKEQAAHFILSNKEPSIYIIISDQFPSSANKKMYVDFLHQHTASFTGIEKMTKLKKASIYYAELLPCHKHYSLVFQEINPDCIVKDFYAKLESSIQKSPHTWLWSHRRWKYT